MQPIGIRRGIKAAVLGIGFALMSSVSTAQEELRAHLESILIDRHDQELGQDDFAIKQAQDARVQWALKKASRAQKAGDQDLRNKFLSLALVYVDTAEYEEIVKEQVAVSGPSASQSSKKAKFERIYGEGGGMLSPDGGLKSKEVQTQIDQAVDSQINMEKWFVGLLTKMGILSTNYKELNDKLRAKYPHLSQDQLADHLIRESSRLTAGVGFVAALPGVFPGAGTAAQIAVNVGTLVPDMIFLFKKQATLIFRIAEIYGRDLKEEDRVTEALILFGVASGVSAATRALEQYLENGITIYLKAKITREAIEGGITKAGLLNPILGDILSTLFAKKFISEAAVEKAAVSVIPLVGAGVSGAMNYVFTKKVGQIAKVFYKDDLTNKLEAVNNLKLPKVELAMFRSLVLMMNADGKQEPVEVLTLKKIANKYPHNRKLVERLINGDQELLAKLDYDISQESDMVKEQIMYALNVLSYVDLEKGPAEIELSDSFVQKFGVPAQMANDVEIRVKREREINENVVKKWVGVSYRKYQKLIGAEDDVQD